MKTCTRCKEQFPIEQMRRAYCFECKKIVEVKNNPLRKKWNKENKDKNKIYASKYTTNQKQDPLRVLQWNCNIGINRALRVGWYNNKQLKEWVGLEAKQLKLYIESLWLDGMSWDNYGRKIGCWNIDHIIPPSSVKTREEIIMLQHYTNLRPLWHSENVSKRNKK